MTYKKPTPLVIPQEYVFALIGGGSYNVKQFGVELNLPISLGVVYKDHAGKNLNQLVNDIVAENHGVLIKPEISSLYYEIKTMTFHCAWLGEVLLLRLKEINDEIRRKGKYYDLITKFIESETKRRECKTTYERLDFMGHKVLLSTILKEYEKRGGKLPFDRATFSALFQEIITQRNNFTHGHLFLFKEEAGYRTILESNSGTLIIEANNLNSFNECFEDLMNDLVVIKQIVERDKLFQ